MRFLKFQRVVYGLLIVLACSAAFSQDIGDTVQATKAVELKVEDKVVASVAVGDSLAVRKVSGNWLWVQTKGGQRGWVLKENVQAIEEPAAVPQAAPDLAPAKPAQPKTGDDPRLTAIGVLAGQNIYTTYAYIGAVADGYGKASYSSAQVQQLMAEVASMASVASRHLQEVRATNIVEEDRDAIDNVLSIFELLTKEANALSGYAKSGSDADLRAYDDARTEVWPKVKGMLDLK
jgi:hypothetical protein